jgi:hypothetical protein
MLYDELYLFYWKLYVRKYCCVMCAASSYEYESKVVAERAIKVTLDVVFVPIANIAGRMVWNTCIWQLRLMHIIMVWIVASLYEQVVLRTQYS